VQRTDTPGPRVAGPKRGVVRRLVMLATAVPAGCLALLSAGCFVDSILFQPPPSSYLDSAEIQKLTTADGVQISAVYLPNPDARFTLLCSHGNAEDIGLTRPSLELMREHGYAVFAYDYRGYGTSQGKPSEKGCYQDAEAAYAYLVEQLHVPADRIIAHGRSLGGALAVYVASREPVAGLILESAFLSVFRCVTRLPLPGDKFCNIDRISGVHCPVLIMNGTADRVVPFWHGQKLYDAANEPKLSLWVEDGTHNTLMRDAGQAYWDKMAELATLVPPPAAQPAGD
jgi:abhydrolase domain-containing protein 17